MNDADFSACKFSAGIVPYMYDELSTAERSVFESHLLNCGECTDEFAVISNARYEVYEWKKLEFEPLATPRFAIPYDDSAITWFDKVRAAFGQRWAVPGLAFAGLAVVAVFAAVLVFQGDVPDVASTRNTNGAVVQPPPVDLPQVVSEPVATDTTDRRAPASARQTVKTGASPLLEPKRINRIPRRIPARPTEARSTSAQKLTTPRLDDYAEDEDTSLRLAELFEDIETSD